MKHLKLLLTLLVSTTTSIHLVSATGDRQVSAENLFQQGMRQFGMGYEENYREAYSLFRQAGDEGHLLAQAMQGILIASGKGASFDAETVRERKAKAQELLAPLISGIEKSANSGNLDAQFVLALCHANGNGVEKNMGEGCKWLQEAAEQGHAGAQFFLAVDFMMKDDEAKAVDWYRKAAEQNYPAAQHILGMSYLAKEEEAEAFKWQRKAAEQGHAGAQSWLGLCYLEGWFGIPRNIAEGKKLLRKAAAQGDTVAKERLKRFGIESDTDKAEEPLAETPEPSTIAQATPEAKATPQPAATPRVTPDAKGMTTTEWIWLVSLAVLFLATGYFYYYGGRKKRHDPRRRKRK